MNLMMRREPEIEAIHRRDTEDTEKRKIMKPLNGERRVFCGVSRALPLAGLRCA